MDQILEDRGIGGNDELGNQGAHAVFQSIQGGLIAGVGYAVEGDIDAEDPQQQGGRFSVIRTVDFPDTSHLPDVHHEMALQELNPGIAPEEPNPCPCRRI